MSRLAIKTVDLSKIYELRNKKSIHALNNVNLEIEKGKTFGLLGPNGAGKTTTVQILTTIIRPTSGKAFVGGYDVLKEPRRAKSLVALMLGSSMIYYRMKGIDNLKFFCKIYKVPFNQKKVNEMAKDYGLDGWLDQYVEKYSSGMKTKLALMKTFLLNREILFLDEPTLGVDVKLKDFVIKRLKESNKTIFLTSHDMEVIEKLCDQVAFIKHGKIIKQGSKDEIERLRKKGIKVKLGIKNDEKRKLKNTLEREDFIVDISENNKSMIITLEDKSKYSDFFSILRNYKIESINQKKTSIEEVFKRII